jgi:hypothetical protein
MANEKTRLDSDTTKPATNAPGDAPADTTDPREVAHTVTPDPGPEAIAAGTVNAQKPGDPIAETPATTVPKRQQRIEEYDVLGPDNKPVRVRHNIDTGETSKA